MDVNQVAIDTLDGCDGFGLENRTHPIIDNAIDHQVDPIGCAMVDDAMWQVEIEIPALALVHNYPLLVQVELDIRVGEHRYMEAHLAICIAEIVISVLANARSRAQLEQAYRLKLTLERRQQLLSIWAAAKRGRVGKLRAR